MGGFEKYTTPCNIENWDGRLFAFSIPTILIKLYPEDRDALIGMYEGKTKPADLEGIRIRLEAAIERFPEGAYIKLGSRSPKDSFLGYVKGFKCETGSHAVNLLCDSERVRDDLYVDRKHKYDTHIAVRKWIPIEPEQEFRCFYKNRKLVAISQYSYLDDAFYPWIANNLESIQFGIEQISSRLSDHLPADDVIADYIVYIKEVEPNHRLTSVKLLECNPFTEDTDPCLFNWRDDKFDTFEFRCVKELKPKIEASFDEMFLKRT